METRNRPAIARALAGPTGLFLLAVTPVAQTTRLVPSQYPTIEAAISASVSGDTVLVSPGVYREHDVSFGGRNLIVRSTDGPWVTVLDAEQQGRIFFVNGSGTTTIEGFTLQDGHAPDGAAGADAYWAGSCGSEVYVSAANGDPGADGGAILCSGNLLLRRCRFLGNRAGAGGKGGRGVDGYGCWDGVYPKIYFGTDGANGGAGGSGGAVATSGSVTLDVYACLFIGNESGHGGAGGNGGAGGDAPTASFSDGRDGGDGGNGWFTGSGAAIYAAGGTVTLRRSTFLENDASFIASNGLGGPGGEGDTIFADDGADGQDGGWAVGPTWAAFHTPTAVVAGCVAWGNTPEDVLLGSATYSDIEVGGLGMTFPGAGNLNTDPFLDAQGWPVSISPCIDAGWDPGLGGDISGNAVLDIGSKPNVGAGATAFADMGAVEYGYPPAAPLANVFVDESNGDPSPDGSFANPYPTIQQGFTAIPANQFLGVISGTYDESVLTFSGKHVTIRALGGVVTIQ